MARATILVVDDEDDVRDFVAAVLDASGYAVLTAADGEQGLAVLRDATPDAVLLDVTMPNVDGWTVLDALKATAPAEAVEVPVIMLTALGTVTDKLRGGIGGALQYITKPFEIDELLRVLDDVLAPSAPTESVRRRQVQQDALAQLVRIEQGGGRADLGQPRVHLTRLEAPAPASFARPRPVTHAREHLASLSESQRRLLDALEASGSVTVTAERLQVSRSNVYASLRRIARRLQVRGAAELIELVRRGELSE